MKYLLGLILFIPCMARAQQGVQVVHEVATSTNSITQTINLLAATVTDVATTTSSGTLGGYFAIEAYNPATSTSTVNCGFDLSLSTTIGNAWYGREVPAGVGVYFAVLSPRKLYCMTQNSVGATRLTVTQFK